MTGINVSIQNALNTALYSTLSGSTVITTALGGTAIYYGQAPVNADLPYVVWSYQFGSPDNITPSESSSQILYVRAYSGTPAQAGTIDGYISAILHKGNLTVSGWTNFWLARETEFMLPETDESGNVTWTAGAFYRVRLDQS